MAADAAALSELVTQLGYPAPPEELARRLGLGNFRDPARRDAQVLPAHRLRSHRFEICQSAFGQALTFSG
jgi:hypothetical protein